MITRNIKAFLQYILKVIWQNLMWDFVRLQRSVLFSLNFRQWSIRTVCQFLLPSPPKRKCNELESGNNCINRLNNNNNMISFKMIIVYLKWPKFWNYGYRGSSRSFDTICIDIYHRLKWEKLWIGIKMGKSVSQYLKKSAYDRWQVAYLMIDGINLYGFLRYFSIVRGRLHNFP